MTDTPPCLFCRVISGEIPAQRVLETETVLAFRDITPQAPIHVLVIPKAHVDSVAQITDPAVAADVLMAAVAVARQEGLEGTGYRLVSNHGADGGQSVHHWHLHVLGGRPMHWPPG
jgi:histidine triad (HIT) family protein